jgi:hypothetical protein
LAWTQKEIDDHGKRIDLAPGKTFFLIIHVHASFKNSEFNTPEILRSISNLSLIDPKEELWGASSLLKTDFSSRESDALLLESFPKESRNSTHPPKKGVTLADRASNSSEIESVEWEIHWRFRGVPPLEPTVKFKTGPLMWVAKTGNLEWKTNSIVKYGKPVDLIVAQATVDLHLAPPRWTILRRASVLPLDDKSTILIEAIVENRSLTPTILSRLSLRATHFTRAMSSGIEGPQWETIELKWPELVVTNTAPLKIESFASLEGNRVEAKAQFRSGHLSGYHNELAVLMPTAIELGPGQIKRFVVKVKESFAGKRRSGHGGPFAGTMVGNTSPPGLGQWDRFVIGMFPAESIFPSVVEAQK